MNNTVEVYYVSEEEKLETLHKSLEEERAAFRRQSVIESRIAGVALIGLGTVCALIGGQLMFVAIGCFCFSLVALFGRAE